MSEIWSDDISSLLDFEIDDQSIDWSSSATSALTPSSDGDFWPDPSSVQSGLPDWDRPKPPSVMKTSTSKPPYFYNQSHYKGQEVILSFGEETNEEDLTAGAKRKRKNPAYAREHVLVERRRREKMGQWLLQLSTLLPGLNKIDKASIIEEATKYIKQLEEQVENLEQDMKEKTQELMELSGSEKSKTSTIEDGSPSHLGNNEEYDNRCSTNSSLDIEVNAIDRAILIEVHSKKDFSLMDKIFHEIEKLHLRPLKSNILSFGNSYIDITVVTQMEEEFCMAVEELVQHLRQALQ